MTTRANGPRYLAVAVAAFVALLAQSTLANASLSLVDQSANKDVVAVSDTSTQSEGSTQAALPQNDQAKSDDQAKKDEQAEDKEPKHKAKRVVQTKVIPGSNGTVCKPVGNGLCKVLHVQSQPTLLRPVRVMRLGGGFFR